jgi:SNF2 family DNA or RNA helicase
MPSGYWHVADDGQAIELLDDSNTSVGVKATDIYDAEFGGRTVINGLTVGRPSTELSSTSFSPQLAVLRISLRDDAGAPKLTLETFDAKHKIADWPTSDQLLVGGSWSAYDPRQLEQSATRLAENGIGLDAPLTPNQVFWLLWDEDVDVEPGLPAAARKFFEVSAPSRFDELLLRAALYPYQIIGSEYLAELARLGLGSLLADEMGLGKTIQAIYALASASRFERGPSLVVCPSSLIANWEREFDRFAPHLRILSHVGARRTGDPSSFESIDVVVTSYDLAIRDRYLLDSVEWELIVVDEAQAIKNPSALRSLALKSFRRRGAVAITGTPIENSLTDMWSIFEFLVPDYLGSIETFESSYPDQADAARALSKRVAPLVIRRTVAEVATDLPPRIDIPSPIYLSEGLVELYEEVRAGDQIAIAKLTRLREVCSAPSMIDDVWVWRRAHIPKFERTMEILDAVVADSGKLLVFAPFTAAIDQIAGWVTDRFPSIYVATVDGRSSPSDRQAIIDDFSADSGSAVLVMNPKAAGVGLNIQAANYVIHFSPEWNPATVEQASARAYRRGQTRPVFVYYLYYLGTVEELMMERLEEKRELQRAGLSAASSEPSSSEIAEALKKSPVRRRTEQH